MSEIQVHTRIPRTKGEGELGRIGYLGSSGAAATEEDDEEEELQWGNVWGGRGFGDGIGRWWRQEKGSCQRGW
jgi:hypothetical protein